ncbi:hypothetical protein ACWGI9_19930 [Streptomyces sp. NPDC054833]
MNAPRLIDQYVARVTAGPDCATTDEVGVVTGNLTARHPSAPEEPACPAPLTPPGQG